MGKGGLGTNISNTTKGVSPERSDITFVCHIARHMNFALQTGSFPIVKNKDIRNEFRLKVLVICDMVPIFTIEEIFQESDTI